MGSDIIQHDDLSVTLSQAETLSDVDLQVLLHCVGKGRDEIADSRQATTYRHVVEKMLFIVPISAPLMILLVSITPSKLFSPRCHHLRALAKTLNRLETNPAA